MDATSESVQKPPLLEKLFEGDPYLRHHESDLLLRWNKMLKLESAISSAEGGLAELAQSYKSYGVVQMQNGDVEVACGDFCAIYAVLVSRRCVNGLLML